MRTRSRSIYATQDEDGAAAAAALPSIPKELIDQFVSGPMRRRSNDDQKEFRRTRAHSYWEPDRSMASFAAVMASFGIAIGVI